MPAKNGGFDQFKGSNDYVTSEELRKSVNVAISLGKPLLIRGEPGTGKTRLAHSIAKGLEKKLIVWNIKSTTKAQEGLYVYDTVQTAGLGTRMSPISNNISNWANWDSLLMHRNRWCCSSMKLIKPISSSPTTC